MSASLLLDEIDTEAIINQWVAKAAGDEEERREILRTPFCNAAKLITTNGERNVMCRDISRRGVGIVMYGGENEVESGTLAVEMHGQTAQIEVDFRWSRSMGNDWWVCGGRLRATSINRASLAYLKFSGLVERRLHQRYSFCFPFSVYTSVDLDGVLNVEDLPPYGESPALSLDISRGGMRLLCLTELNYNNSIYVRKPMTDYLLRGRLVSHRDLGNGFCVIGIRFATT